LNVMSRPVNYWHRDVPTRELIWSYLYIDLADRRYTNWLWKKLEGNRQRAIFLDHAKREFTRLQKVLSSESHFLLKESHDYDKYEKSNDYDYMTTLSLPVYSRRKDDVDIIGVAGVDVSIKLLYSLIPHHTVSPFTLSPLKLKESFPDRSQRIRFHHHKQRIHPDASRTQTRGIHDCCCCCSCYPVGSSLRTSRSRRSTESTYSRWKY
jgi:hypothetical protein